MTTMMATTTMRATEPVDNNTDPVQVDSNMEPGPAAVLAANHKAAPEAVVVHAAHATVEAQVQLAQMARQAEMAPMAKTAHMARMADQLKTIRTNTMVPKNAAVRLEHKEMLVDLGPKDLLDMLELLVKMERMALMPPALETVPQERLVPMVDLVPREHLVMTAFSQLPICHKEHQDPLAHQDPREDRVLKVPAVKLAQVVHQEKPAQLAVQAQQVTQAMMVVPALQVVAVVKASVVTVPQPDWLQAIKRQLRIGTLATLAMLANADTILITIHPPKNKLSFLVFNQK